MKSVYTAFILLACFQLAACKKFLYQEPYNNLSINDVFKDMEGARTTLSGCYDDLKSTDYYLRNFYIYADLTGGNIKYSKSGNQVMLNTYNFSNDPINNDMSGFYKTAYSVIYNANTILKYADSVSDATTLQKNRLKADAYAIRAIVHFDLVRVFAQPYGFTADASHKGIIIRNKNAAIIDPIPAASSVKQVYDQVNADLDTAIKLYTNSTKIFTSDDDRTYLSAEAAKALQSRVALYQNDWAKVVANATDVIGSGKFTLTTNAAYVNSWSKKNISNESIFELAYGTRTGGSLGDYYNPTNSQYGQLAATADVTNLFAAGDVRGVNTMFVKATVNSVSYNFTKKYQGMSDSANNIKVVRLSELYLNRAEAYAEQNNLTSALADLNVIRKRANPAAVNFASTDKAIVINEILLERRRELCFEGQTLFDVTRKQRNLVRTDCTSSNCSVNYPSEKFAVAIPINN